MYHNVHDKCDVQDLSVKRQDMNDNSADIAYIT